MTEAQNEMREERIAIMMHLGVATEEEAHAFCDRMPELYGIRDTGALVQSDLPMEGVLRANAANY